METIVGQSRATNILQTALRSGRVHHAWIFHGLPGVGKFTTAIELAKILLCHDRQTDLAGQVVACDGCASCRYFQSSFLQNIQAKSGSKKKSADAAEASAESQAIRNGHPDLHVITKELARHSADRNIRNRKQISISVDVIREFLLAPIGLKSQLQHGRVVIIDEAELLGIEAGNALLKTLEEPPAGTVLILITSNEEKLLITIRSRCQRVAFAPLDNETLANEIQKRHPEILPERLPWLVEFASGSLGRAMMAIDYQLTDWSQTILPGLEAMGKGRDAVRLGKEMSDSIEKLAKTWVERHENASKEAANKMAANLMWSMIAQYARTQIAKAAAQTTDKTPAQAQAMLDPWLYVLEALGKVESELAANVNMGLASDHLSSMLVRCLKPLAAAKV